jgi:hypothetical protein
VGVVGRARGAEGDRGSVGGRCRDGEGRLGGRCRAVR